VQQYEDIQNMSHGEYFHARSEEELRPIFDLIGRQMRIALQYTQFNQ